MKPAHAVLTVLLGAGMVGCTPDWARQNQTGLIMEIAQIQGAGTAGSNSGISDFILSDVSNGVNDNAVLTVNVYRKNPTVTATSALEHVRLERYEVRYFRSDGRDQEGVDVPFRFTGPLNVRFHTPTGTGEIEQDVAVIIVRHQAKFEPPLANLVRPGSPADTGGIGGPFVLSTIAEVTVHARQVTTGEGLTASARAPITFADFVDQ